MKITIKGKEIELKYSIRALMMYENIKEETFTPTNITSLVTFMYCIVVASSKDFSLSLEDIVEVLDENPDLLKEFTDWLTVTSNNQNKLKKE